MPDNKKLTILIVLIVVMLIVWMPKGRRTAPVSPKTAAFSLEKVVPQETPAQRRRTEFTDWGRNPFVWTRAGASAGVADLALSGIIWDNEDSYAIINGAVVHLGDGISGKTIKRIEPTKVILTDGVNDYTLALE